TATTGWFYAAKRLLLRLRGMYREARACPSSGTAPRSGGGLPTVFPTADRTSSSRPVNGLGMPERSITLMKFPNPSYSNSFVSEDIGDKVVVAVVGDARLVCTKSIEGGVNESRDEQGAGAR